MPITICFREGSVMSFSSSMIARHVTLGALLLVLAAAPAFAVTLGAESDPSASGDEDDYAQGATAFEREDWPAVIDHMTKATAERPWHDDAYNLMGFAYRKLGDYDKALQSYDRALELNPHHRGALEYLGEAYLELDQPELRQGDAGPARGRMQARGAGRHGRRLAIGLRGVAGAERGVRSVRRNQRQVR